ncbi:MAG: 50S ribosomal protein L11 methyltransferase [Bacteroidota bacterium]
MNPNQQLIVSCNSEYREILMAELAMSGCDSFQETKDGFIAHSDPGIEDDLIEEVFERYRNQAEISFEIIDIIKQNWNQKWEKSYEPIVVGDKCIVRASFHEPQPGYQIEIIINPKMSFGTGHHETTSLIMASQFNIDHNNKKVLDAGCGTGILSILAGKLGASEITAYDNDEWVKENIQENLKINDIYARVLIGTAQNLKFDQKFDIILANINKNILLVDIPYYAAVLQTGGQLLMSGFYKSDIEDTTNLAEENGLNFIESNLKNDWAMVRLEKN